MVRFSLVTICYNAESLIAETMESVLRQDAGVGFEYIIVDGASKDRTFAIARSYEQKFAAKGISLRCYSEPDNGISDAFNKGILHAEGEIVGLVNAGDCLTKDALKVLNEAYAEDVDIFYGNILWVDKEQGVQYTRHSSADVSALRFTMPIMHPACYIRKTAYETVGMYKTDFRYAMDRELLARMWKAGRRFKFINHVFSEMSAGGVSDSSAYNSQRKAESRSIALACGVSPLLFEYVYAKGKLQYYLIKTLKKYPQLFLWLRGLRAQKS